MKPLSEILKLTADYLQKAGIDSPRREAENLLCDFLSFTRTDLYLNFDRPFEEKELEALRTRVARRAKGEPSQYIHGAVPFYGLILKVNPHVLIPRQETEILVDMIVKQGVFLGKSLLDLCSGSGCIGLALKHKFPDLNVTLSDISKDALEVARQNAHANHLDVDFFEGDLFEPLKGRKFDGIVCNPPYVSDEEYENLSSDVGLFEPKIALLGGKSGLDFYKRLADELPLHLNPNGKVWLEIGSTQGNAVMGLFSDPLWKKKTLQKDWAGHHRFISLEIE